MFFLKACHFVFSFICCYVLYAYCYLDLNIGEKWKSGFFTTSYQLYITLLYHYTIYIFINLFIYIIYKIVTFPLVLTVTIEI